MAERVWTVRDALTWTTAFLGEKGVEQPRVSAEWLLSAATGLSRVEVYAYHDRPLAAEELEVLRAGVKSRATGAPLQYVTGEVPFRHVVLRVRPGVFIPRPETEVLVGEALEALTTMGGDADGTSEALVVDLCTGSGCVACSIAAEHTGARVLATDLSDVAVAAARENAERLGVSARVTVYEGDLFGPLPREFEGRIDIVVTNPPYVPTADLPSLPSEVLGYEPRLALDGGADGLDVARRIMREALGWLGPGRALLMELDERYVDSAAVQMEAWYEEVRTVSDLAGRPRIVIGRAPGADTTRAG